MKIPFIKKPALSLILTAMAVLSTHAQYQQITWEASQGISSDSDVVNNGTLVGTYSPYLILNPSVSSIIVNGVAFQSNSLNAVTSGMTNSTVLGTNVNLTDSNYATLLSGASDTPFNTDGAGYIMFSNLTLGDTYQIQIWAQNVNDTNYDQWENFYETSYSGTSQGNGYNTTAAVNYDLNGSTSTTSGNGEYVIGTFTATNSVVQIHFEEWSEVWGSGTINANNGQGQINLLQVWELLLPPTITQQPQGTYYVGYGSNVTINAAVAGTPTLSYQWYETNLTAMTGYAIAGQTNSSLIVSNVESSDNYFLTVTNNYGSTNSVTASVVVYTSPLIIGQTPVTYTNPFTLYAGANPTFSVTALGLGTVGYQWFTNGVLDGAAMTKNLQITNVQIGSFSNYCIITNSSGSATSALWSAFVIADPTNSTGGPAPYPQQVLALSPISYWRLNEMGGGPSDNSQGANDGLLTLDYAGGNDGLYANTVLGNSGYNPTEDPSDTSAQFGPSGAYFTGCCANQIQGINFGSPVGTSVAFTAEAWVSGYAQSSDAGLVTVGYSGQEQFDLDTGSDGGSSSHAFRFFYRDASGNSHLVNSSVVPGTDSQGPWYHLVAVVDEINSQTVTLYINGQPVGSASAPSGSGVLGASSLMSIGSRMNSASDVNFSDQFNGFMNDVAIFNHALAPGQVASEYVAGETNVAPFFVPVPPNSATASLNTPLTLPATAYGNGPLWYQWINTNTDTILAMGTTNGSMLNASYTISSTPGSLNNETLELVVTNTYGVISNFVTITVLASPPQITANLPVNVTVAQGQSYAYSATFTGAIYLGYQWYSNGIAIPLASQTGISSTTASGTYSPPTTSLGTNTYYMVVTNFAGPVTSTVSTFVVLAPPTNAYAAAILSLNPVAYWPMHEVEAAAPGDIETNYGSLGILATGYYPDWEYNSGQFSKLFMGPLACGCDDSVFFTDHNSQTTSTTNQLFVPRNSPLSTLSPPFTVECWVYETNNTYQGDIWSQNLYEGLNAGSANNGNGNDEGIRLNLGTSGATQGIQVFSYYNGSSANTVIGLVPITTNQWYHVVLTCSASTNLILYTNGVPIATNSAVGKFGVDTWAPFTVASGRGDSRTFSLGAISEMAAYTNALSATDIATHYAAGINPNPSPTYYQLIANDNPTIWLRMNSPVYNPPPTGTWPVLLNFGSAAVAGVYTPGTMPGMGTGPVHTNGAPINGLSGTNVALLSGVSSFADAGYAAAYNPVGPKALSVTAMFRGNPIPALIETIVGHGTNSWTISLSPTNGVLQCTLGGIGTLSASGNYNDGNWHQVVAEYAPGASPSSPGSAYIYVDGALNTSLVGLLPTTGIEPGTSSDVMIGADPEFTNNPSGVGRQFGGQVCEVALFTNALTAAQITALYAAAGGGGPSVTSIQPLTATNASGTGTYTNFSVSATSGGAVSLAYQWYFNTASNYNGVALANNIVNYTNVTTATLTIANLVFADSGWYYAIVTNLYGSATSGLASLTVVSEVNPHPTIVFSVTNNALTLIWPMDYTGWQLQAQTNSVGIGIWTNWVNLNSTTGTNKIVIPINLTNGCIFYRLMYP